MEKVYHTLSAWQSVLLVCGPIILKVLQSVGTKFENNFFSKILSITTNIVDKFEMFVIIFSTITYYII